MVCDIVLQIYRDLKIRVCGKDLISFLISSIKSYLIKNLSCFSFSFSDNENVFFFFVFFFLFNADSGLFTLLYNTLR